MRIPTAIVSLIVLFALAAAVLAKSATHKTAPSADLKDSADDYCSRCVDGYAPRYRPIRGADEVRICEDGYYCDCQAGRKIKCKTVVWVHGNFDPDHPDSPCSLTFSCQEWFDKHPVPTPSSPTTSPASSSPPPSSTSPTPASSSLSPSSTPPTPASSSLAPSSTRPTPASSSLSPYSTRSTPASSSLSPYSTRPTPASSSPSPYSTRPTPASSSPSPYSTRPTPASSSLSPYSTRPTPASSSLAPSSTTSSPSTPVPSTTCLPTQCPFRLSLMLPDPTDCHRYIRCYNGESWNMPCAIGTWFSFSHQACVYLEQSDCAIKN